MTPVNLGDLPSAEPVPTGLGQLKRGNQDGQVQWADWTQMYHDSAPLYEMRISIYPPRPGWWVIRAENIFLMAEAAWYYFHWFVRCSPADANGITDEHNYHRLHSALNWQQSCIDTAFKVNASTYYEAGMFYGGRSGGTVYRWTGSTYSYISGEFIAEGSL